MHDEVISDTQPCPNLINNGNPTTDPPVDKKCPACQNGDLPTGAHRCMICRRPVHIFDSCSLSAIGTEEGYGQGRICMQCVDKATSAQLHTWSLSKGLQREVNNNGENSFCEEQRVYSSDNRYSPQSNKLRSSDQDDSDRPLSTSPIPQKLPVQKSPLKTNFPTYQNRDESTEAHRCMPCKKPVQTSNGLHNEVNNNGENASCEKQRVNSGDNRDPLESIKANGSDEDDSNCPLTKSPLFQSSPIYKAPPKTDCLAGQNGDFPAGAHRCMRLQKNIIFPEESQSSEMVETAINQHFAHLHGVLQNVERHMIDKLYKQRNDFMINLSDIQQRLKTQEDQLQSALLMAATVNEIIGRINLADVIPELERLADMPCHLVHDPVVEDEKIVFCPDPSIIEIIENHCKIEIPKVSRYSLLSNKILPMDYEVEPLNTQGLPKLWDESFTSNTTLMKRASSCQSLSSRLSESRTLREGGTCLVTVGYIQTPSNFYIQQVSYKDKLRELERQIANYATHSVHVPSEVQINKLYIVKRATKNKWYRGRVNAVNTIVGAPDTYDVFDVDYGGTETQVPSSRMRQITDDLSTMPQMAINCSLYDIVPFDGTKWRSAARKVMCDYVAKPSRKYGNAVTMHIINIIGNKYYVDICQEPLKDGQGSQVSVRDALIFLGHGAFVTSQYLRRTCPQSVRRFLREDMPLETYFHVMCSHVESPDCIYVQKAGDHLLFLATLTTDMSEHYNHLKRKFNNEVCHVPEIGVPCAVEKLEGEWYRGTVISVPSAGMVEVLMVDFGSKITRTYDKIRKLNERFMVSPIQAIKVTLTDIKPRDGAWCEEAIEFTKKYIDHNFARVFAFEKSVSGYKVALYVGEDENYQNFATILAGSSLAVSTGPRSSGQAEVTIGQTNSKNHKPKIRNSRTIKTKKTKWSTYVAPQPFAVEVAKSDPYKLLVKIVRVVSPDMIYVCNISLEKEYEQMKTEMQKFYNKYTELSNKSDWQVKSPCVVYSSRDRCFCRGEITAFKSSEEVQVFLCDLALTETVPISELQGLKKKFWNTSTYACKVKLAGILPCGGSSVWPSSSCEKLKDIIAENQNSKFYISKVVIPDEDELNVDLWVEEVVIDGPLVPARIEMNSINRKLVEIGLALPIKQYNEKKTKILALELKRQISFTDESSKNDSIDWTSNGDFKIRRNTTVTPTNDIGCDESFASSESSFVSNEEEFFESSTSSEDSLVSTDRTLVPTEPKLESWLPAEPILDDNFVALPTYLDHDCFLYLHPKSQSTNILRFIEATLTAEYSNSKIGPSDFEWKAGDLCIAQYHANKKWYRAQVIQTLDNNMIEVEFIDYGSIEECENGTLKKRLTLTDIPRQSTKCSIYGLVPNTPNGKWRLRDLDKIHELIVDKECEVSVLNRKSDHLVVSIVLLTPTRHEIISYLINELRLEVRADFVDVEYSNDDLESTIDNSADVIIDGYVKNTASEEEKSKNNQKDENNKDEGEREKEDNKSEDDTKNGNEENAKNETNDFTPHLEEALPCLDDDAFPTENIENLTYNVDDAVISGTANFTLSACQIEISQQEAMGKLESESVDDTNSIRDGEIITSTPFNESFAHKPKGYKALILPKAVKLVKTEVVLVGLTKAWLHLLDNEQLESITKLRDLYENIMQDMQHCANEQPVLRDFEKRTPCCAKFEDNKWYRCQVYECGSDPYQSRQMVRVLFVDWGNIDSVRCDEIRTLKDEWFEAPCMAFRCRLWGVIEAPLADSDDIGKMKIRQAWKVDEKPPRPVHVKIEGRSGSFYDVQIYTDEECTELVYQSLIDDGLFLNTKTKDD